MKLLISGSAHLELESLKEESLLVFLCICLSQYVTFNCTVPVFSLNHHSQFRLNVSCRTALAPGSNQD